MKNTVIIILAAMICAPVAFAAGQDEILSKRDLKLALDTIDGQCGDSWCEGDFNYRFDWMGCHAGRSECVLRYSLIDTETDGKTTHEWATHCTISGIRNVQDVLEKDPHTTTLNEKFADLLGRCFQKREAEFRKRTDSPF